MSGDEHDGQAAAWQRTGGDSLQRMLYYDCHAWLADNLLERGDRMAMAASVESRPPFLDHHLVELAFRVPSSLKVRRGTTKWILRRIADGLIPKPIIERRKVGFRVPLDRWFRDGLREFAHDLLLSSDSFANSVFDADRVRAIMDEHDRGRRNREMQIWTLLCLEVWHQAFFGLSAAAKNGQAGD